MKATAKSPVERLPVVTSRWTWRDRLGAFAVRWNVGRSQYRVAPGLYATGNPTPNSPVLVTANYKLTFDRLRQALPGIDAWILVLNTRGINVWCAAGKGTFGTDELVKKIRSARLASVVKHATVILPQLGAPGVAAHEVTRQTGFTVVYGPVRATDIPAFLRAGMQCTPAMRQVTFPVAERLALVPVELVQRLGPALGVWLFFLLLAVLRNGGLDGLAGTCLRLTLGAGGVFLAGTVLVPALLPWLPGRALAVKGAVIGLGVGLVPMAAGLATPASGAGFLLLAMAACSYLGLMFTGSTHYTSASGVRWEIRRAIPLQLAAALIGTVLWCI
jgi:acetyl-CoA decarbonylase/synthase complex subunit gamma